MYKKANFVCMKLANYINDLLYRYDCVIVPNFGGFITNKIGASISDTHTFSPPTKQISFNANLKHNDGLLANYVASIENISFEKATTFINTVVLKWQDEIENNAIEISAVGVLTLNEEKQIVFEPNTTSNFLTESFGLSTITASATERFKEQVIPLIPVNEAPVEETARRTMPAFIKVAAAAAILLTVGTLGFNEYNKTQEATKFAKQQEKVEQKIQSATFVIDSPLPTINLNASKANTKDFHVVAGAFQLTKNAQKKVNQLINQGYNARVLGVNKWGLTQVSFDSYETKEEARIALESIKGIGFEDAWLLVKNFN